MTVLLIESDRLLAGNITSALKLAGHKTIWQVDLQTAIETLDSDQPGAVILDLALAARSGVEFLYELRSYPEWQNLPVIIWSDLSLLEAKTQQAAFKDFNISAFHHKPAAKIKDIITSLETSPLST